MELGIKLIKEWEVLKANRDNMSQTFREVAFYCMPEIYDYVQTNDHVGDAGSYSTPADMIGSDMVNSLASALFSNTVSMGDRWFSLRATAEDLNEVGEIADFYSKLTDVTIKALQNSNFALMVHESLRHSCGMGTGIMGSSWNKTEETLVYNIMRVSDCTLTEDSTGLVDGLFFEIKYTPMQAYDAWGDDIPKEVKAKLDGSEAHIKDTFIRCIRKRTKRDGKSKLSTDMKYMDTVVHVDSKKIVSDGGHPDFPYTAHRFMRVEGTPYGRSPAMNAMGSLKMLSRVMVDYIDGVEMTLQPPVFVPSSVEDISLSPGAVNEYDPTLGGKPMWMSLGVDLSGTHALMERYEKQIRDIFFIDKFIAIEQQKNMTATEVIERVNEKIQAISPVVSRLQSEFMAPVIERTVRLLIENGRAPEIPEALLAMSEEDGGIGGDEFKVEYTTRLDAKLSEIDTNSLMLAIQQAATILMSMQEAPELDVIVDKDVAIKLIFRNNNVDPDITRDASEIEEIRRANALMAEAAQKLEQMKGLVKPMDMGKAVEPGSPAESMELPQL